MKYIAQYVTAIKLPAFEKRFWEKVAIAHPDVCWPWLASTCRQNYGQVVLPRDGSDQFKAIATRVSYFLHYGIDPGELLVRHKCDNTICCNPHHLELGTHEENMQDKIDRDRNPRGDGHAHAKLTYVDVRKIRTLLTAEEKSLAQIGVLFGVNKSAIYKIKHKITWKNDF